MPDEYVVVKVFKLKKYLQIFSDSGPSLVWGTLQERCQQLWLSSHIEIGQIWFDGKELVNEGGSLCVNWMLYEKE